MDGSFRRKLLKAAITLEKAMKDFVENLLRLYDKWLVV